MLRAWQIHVKTLESSLSSTLERCAGLLGVCMCPLMGSWQRVTGFWLNSIDLGAHSGVPLLASKSLWKVESLCHRLEGTGFLWLEWVVVWNEKQAEPTHLPPSDSLNFRRSTCVRGWYSSALLPQTKQNSLIEVLSPIPQTMTLFGDKNFPQWNTFINYLGIVYNVPQSPSLSILPRFTLPSQYPPTHKMA